MSTDSGSLNTLLQLLPPPPPPPLDVNKGLANFSAQRTDYWPSYDNNVCNVGHIRLDNICKFCGFTSFTKQSAKFAYDDESF